MMTKLERKTLIAVRVMMQAHYAKDSCIAAGRMTLDYLTSVGYDGQCVRATAIVLNRVFAEQLKRRDPTGTKFSEVGAQIIADTPGAWSVGIGAGQGLHVIYIGTRDGHPVLVDLALDQAAREQHDMAILPLIAPMTPAFVGPFLAGNRSLVFNADGVHIIYMRREGEAFKDSPNWNIADAPARRRILDLAKQFAEATVDV